MIIIDDRGFVRAHDRHVRDLLDLGDAPLPPLDAWPDALGLEVVQGDPDLPHERVLAGASHATLDITLRRNATEPPRRLRLDAAPLDGPAGDVVLRVTDLAPAKAPATSPGTMGPGEEAVDAAPVMMWLADAVKRTTYVNQSWLHFTGRSLSCELGEGWIDGIHADEREHCRDTWHAAFEARRGFHMEHRLRRADGAYIWVLTTGAPRFDDDGTLIGYIGTCFDIHARHEAERSLKDRSDDLESLIESRTAQLIESRERLRVADRLALAGSLAQGLGHDMSNILFPVRCRLDAIEPTQVPAALDGLVQAVASSVEYLQELAIGLRMLARDPDVPAVDNEVTELSVWWKRVCPLLISSLPESVALDCEVAPDMSSLPIAPHRLTQAVLNLVVNAGEVMSDGGSITIRGTVTADSLVLAVVDDGPGMPEEVRRQAFDPFFTTKARRHSTGLGLTLVHSVVTMSGGEVELLTSPHRGTTVAMKWSRALLDAAASSSAHTRPRHAAVALADSRMAAWITGLLRAAGYEIDRVDGPPREEHSVLVTDISEAGFEQSRRFLDAKPHGVVIAIGEGDDRWRRLNAIVVPHDADIATVQTAIDDAGLMPGVEP